ncbi:MAG: nucleotidyltransferase [Steroidobacteraceae bacterium]
MAEPSPASLQAALGDLAKWLEIACIPAMIIGGIAASALGRPRLTRDIDALAIVPETNWNSVLQSAARFGIVPRIDGALEFAHRSRVLLLRHNASGIDVDMTFGGLPFERAAVERSVAHDIGGAQVRLPRVEDLLVMKAIARRPKDREDIRGLLAAHPQADISEARRWIREFATAMSTPDMLEEFDELVALRTSRS